MTEWFDGLDINENLIGIDIERGKPIPNDIYHAVVEIYTVNYEHQVLVTQRDQAKPFGLKWEITGGSVLKGEPIVDGALRELKEETGLIVGRDEIKPIYTIIEHPVIYKGFVVKKNFGCQDIVLQKGETIAYKLLSLCAFLDFIKTADFVYLIKNRFDKYREIIISEMISTKQSNIHSD
jgi:8-oxo-dGTP diphosphatase